MSSSTMMLAQLITEWWTRLRKAEWNQHSAVPGQQILDGRTWNVIEPGTFTVISVSGSFEWGAGFHMVAPQGFGEPFKPYINAISHRESITRKLESCSSPCFPVSKSLLPELGLGRVQQQKLLFGHHRGILSADCHCGWVYVLGKKMSFSTVVPSQRITEWEAVLWVAWQWGRRHSTTRCR